MQDNVVGRAKGPGECSNEFKIITPDNKRMKIGEFVYYLHNGEKVLCRLVTRKAVRLFPDELMSDPSIDPGALAAMMGVEGAHLYEVSATVLGVYDENFGFVNPRLPPDPGVEIYLAEDELLERVISRKKKDEIGSAYVGNLLNRQEGNVRVFLDVAELASKHLAVLAATGSGKSYTVGVILEEMMGRNNRGCVLVIDPHGEYGTIDEMRKKGGAYARELCSEDYVPEVKVVTPDDVKIKVSDLDWGDWRSILRDASDKMYNILRNALYQVRREKKHNFTTDDLLAAVRARLGGVGGGGHGNNYDDRSEGDAKVKSLDGVIRNEPLLSSQSRRRSQSDDYDESSVRGLEWRIDEYIKNRKIFDDYASTTLRKLFAPGQITVLQMTDIEEDDQQLIVSVLLQRLLRARIKTEKDKVTDENSEMFIDFPVFVVLEEAHRFAPHFGEARSKHVLKTILSEGRKFGIGVCLVSQRPGKLDGDALSQCLTQVIMKIINPADQENIKQSVEAITSDLMKELPALTKGQAVIVGEALNTPVLIRVRKRYTRHGGASQNAPKEWHMHTSRDAADRKLAEKAPVKKRPAEPFKF